MASERLRVAWMSDLGEPGRSSIAAYCSRLLLPELQRYHSIELFSTSTAQRVYDLPHHHYLNAFKRHREEPFDLFFYQVEDTRASRFVRSHIGLIPGVTWLHDLYCVDLGPEALHTSPWESNIRQFFDPSRTFLDREIAPHQLCPKAYREASLSPVVLFSSRWVYKEFLQMVSNRLEASGGAHHAMVIPLPVAETSPSHCAPSEVLRVACASVTGIEGRAHKFLPALQQLSLPWQLTWMVSGGEEQAAQALAREWGVEDRVEVVSQRSCEVWAEIVHRSDVALHLHTSPFGHLGPYINLSLEAGCPVVVAWAAQGEDFPEDAVFCVAPGLHESRQLAEIFAAVRTHGSALGVAGRNYIRETSSVSLIAERLAHGFTEWAPQLSVVMERWERLVASGQRALLDEVQALSNRGSIGDVAPFQAVVRGLATEMGW